MSSYWGGGSVGMGSYSSAVLVYGGGGSEDTECTILQYNYT